MTSDEYRKALGAMTDLCFKLFNERLGGGDAGTTREDRIQELVYKPERERAVCYELQQLGQKVETEQEKHVKAVMRASAAALVSSITALIALVFAMLARGRGH